MKQLISAPVLERAAGIRSDFQTAAPFKHACIEDFLLPQWAETLLAEFPVFDPGKAMNEFGKVGRKAVRTDMREISDRYREFYDYISSQPFLDAMSAMTGIPDLRFDKQMYGGGTHENLEGQALDAHVDFNYDQERQLHRRINLLIYLNKEWDVSWGGAIQLHSDPRDWDHDEIKTFNCTFNRCVVFETNEHSWHGFQQIKLPAEKRGLSRKCISIYLYTKDRPNEEIVPVHGTFYVQEPLPDHYRPGLVLAPGHLDELRQLTAERDDWIGFYQRLEADLGGENRGLRAYAESLALHNGVYRLLSGLPPRRNLIWLVRKCVGFYLRVKRRVTDRPVPPLHHGALPPLGPGIAPGRVLDETDVRALRNALIERDRVIQRYQSLELSLRREHDAIHTRITALLHNLRLPLAGGLRQEQDSVRGAYAGGWVSSRLEVKLQAGTPAQRLEVMGWVPPHYPQGMRIEAFIDGRPAGSLLPAPGTPFTLDVAAGEARGGVFALELKTSSAVPLPLPENDQRDLAFVLQGISRV